MFKTGLNEFAGFVDITCEGHTELVIPSSEFVEARALNNVQESI
jgi:hypothetical protein